MPRAYHECDCFDFSWIVEFEGRRGYLFVGEEEVSYSDRLAWGTAILAVWSLSILTNVMKKAML